MKTTRWSPDTCNCQIEIEWDETVLAENRTHTMKTILRCDEHIAKPNQEAFTDVMAENQSKNKAIGLLITEHPEVKQEDVKWEMKPDRSVKIILPDSIKSEKSSLNALAIGKFEKGVIFE